MSTIIVEVSGGVVQEIYSDDPLVDVILIDWDNIEGCGETELLSKFNTRSYNKEEMKKLVEEANKEIQENIDWNRENE
jgi:hypothetical protein